MADNSRSDEIQAAPGFSRRRFAHLLGAGLAGTLAAGRAATAAGAGMAAQAGNSAAPTTAATGGAAAGSAGGASVAGAAGAGPAGAGAAGVVRLSSNESPYGPSPAAFDAMREAFGLAWRYPDEHADALIAEIARQHGVASEQVLLGAGSSEILRLCAVAFTGAGSPAAPTAPTAPVVVAEPTFESLARYTEHHGGAVITVPLTADFRHDLPRMLAAAPRGGLVYLCNPNNPTATITPKADVDAFLAKAPANLPVLVDEAYFHYVEDPRYETVMPLVVDHPNLIVTRTFSKIHGMAGLRCGYAVAQKATIARLRRHQAFDSVGILPMVAALASLRDADHLLRCHRLNREVKATTCVELDRLGFAYLPSAANFLMIDLRRPVQPVIDALQQRHIEVGRRFAALPNHLRVTLGTADQMTAFLTAFRAILPAAKAA